MKDEELDVILDQMAEEVPPMPADFHDRWMNAVRAEAQDAAPAAEDTTQRKTVSLVRWTRILSVAAAFVFLIGGTLLWRSTKQSLSASDKAEKRETAAMTVAEENTAVPAAEEPAVPAAGAAEAGEPSTTAGGGNLAEGEAIRNEQSSQCEVATIKDAEAMMAAGMTEDTETDAKASEEEAGDADLSYAMKAAGSVQNLFEASSDMESEEADYAMESACEAVAVEDAELPVPTAARTAAPTAVPTAALTPVPTAAPTEAPEPEEPGFLQNAGAFFTDMGDFLLAVLPYLLVLAVPAAAALVIRRKKARK